MINILHPNIPWYAVHSNQLPTSKLAVVCSKAARHRKKRISHPVTDRTKRSVNTCALMPFFFPFKCFLIMPKTPGIALDIGLTLAEYREERAFLGQLLHESKFII